MKYVVIICISVAIICAQGCIKNGFKSAPTDQTKISSVYDFSSTDKLCQQDSMYYWTQNRVTCSSAGFVLENNSTKVLKNLENNKTGSVEVKCTNGTLQIIASSCQSVETGNLAPNPPPPPVVSQPTETTAPLINCSFEGRILSPGAFTISSGYKVSVVTAIDNSTSCEQYRDTIEGICDGKTGAVTVTKRPAYAACTVELSQEKCPTNNFTALTFSKSNSTCQIQLSNILQSGSLPLRYGNQGVSVNSTASTVYPATGSACVMCKGDKLAVSDFPARDCSTALPSGNICNSISCQVASGFSWDRCQADNGLISLNWNEEIKLTANAKNGSSGEIILKCDNLNGSYSIVESSRKCTSTVPENYYQYLSIKYNGISSPVNLRVGDELTSPTVTMYNCIIGTSNCTESVVPNEDINWSLTKRPAEFQDRINAFVCNTTDCANRGQLSTMVNAQYPLPTGAQIIIYGSIKSQSQLFGKYSGTGSTFSVMLNN